MMIKSKIGTLKQLQNLKQRPALCKKTACYFRNICTISANTMVELSGNWGRISPSAEDGDPLSTMSAVEPSLSTCS